MALVRADPEVICVGLPESAYPPVPRGLTAGRALIRNPTGQTIHSQPQVQAFADAVMAATGCDSFGTYIGHDSPSPDLALDCFVPKTPRALADAVAQFARDNYQRFGIWYVIRRQQIWNPLIGDYWRDMADRGNDTANHFDHDHVSFLDDFELPAEPAPTPEPPKPHPQQEDDDTMRLIGVTNNRGIFLVGNQPLATGKAKGKVPAVYIGTPEEVGELDASGAAVRDESKPDLPEAVFDRRYVVVG